MQYITASLGVQCNYCHVQGQNDSDDKETKKVAREMMKMVDKLNASFFDGKPRVSCASCHNGRAKPIRTPPLAIDMTPEQAALAAAGRGRGGRGGPGGPAGAAGAPVAGGAPGGPPPGPGGPGRGVAEPPPPPVPTESVDRDHREVRTGARRAAGRAEREDPRHERHAHDARPGIVEHHRTGKSRPASTASTSRRSRSQRHARPTARRRGPLVAAVAVAAAVARAAPEARDLAGFQMQQGLRLADFALPLR